MELGDEVTSGSSIMPQKKNPDSLELIRGKCGRVIGALNSLFVTMKGLPMTYNRDMQEDKEPLFDAAGQTVASLEMARAVVESARLDPAVTLKAAEESWAVATDLADALARNGTPFHQAHRIAGQVVLASVKAGKQPADWTAEELTAFAPEFTPDMIRFMNPAEGMKTRALPGGCAPATVARALDEAEERLRRWRS
jgi:argininosuccinate lyase